MICNNSSAAGGGINLKKLTYNPPDIIMSGDWNQSNSGLIFDFAGLTKDKLGKGCIVGVYKENTRNSVLLYISPDGSAEVVTSGSDVRVKSAYNPSAGTVSFFAAVGMAYGFVIRQD